ncbi:MAG: IPTL-CTERM sorting domain-containing protein [Saprospiraceae bacterium]|nr:IPTL-CTERM sorting domain-containing protein [Saprospiraceae bacterium]
MRYYSILLLSICSFTILQGQGLLLPGQSITTNCGISLASIDITSTGTFLGTGDEEGYPITLPFNFTFPGGLVTDMLSATTNGYLSSDITDDGPDLSNDCPLPAIPSTGGGARIYLLQDDIEVNGGLYFQNLLVPHPTKVGLSSVVIYYAGIDHYPSFAEIWDMAIVLYSNGDYIFVYGPGNTEDGSGSTTGIQDITATSGLLFLPCDTGGQGLGTSLTNICILGAAGGSPIPTLGQWGFMILVLLLITIGVIKARQPSKEILFAE